MYILTANVIWNPLVIIIILSSDYFKRYFRFNVPMSPFCVPFPVYDYPNIYFVIQSKTEYKNGKTLGQRGKKREKKLITPGHSEIRRPAKEWIVKWDEQTLTNCDQADNTAMFSPAFSLWGYDIWSQISSKSGLTYIWQ